MRIVIALTLVMLFGSMHSAFAQATSSTYTLGPEDTIAVTVLRHPEFSGTFLIPPDGVVDLPGIGKLAMTGLTVDQVQTHLHARLRERLRDPEVSVTLAGQRARRVYILGAVARPGIYDHTASWRIAEALAAAGGLNAEPQDHTVTVLRAADGERVTVNLTEVLAGDPNANIPVASGDVITIGVVQKMPVYVTGLVQNPGILQLRPDEGTAEALALAGGISKPDVEVAVTVQRGNEVIPVDPAVSLPMAQGDILAVRPLRDVRVMIAGQIKSPGFYDLRQGEGVLETLALAGGATSQAALTRVTIVRAAGPREQIDLTPALLDADTNANVALYDGDMVLVPENTNTVTVLGYVKQPGRYALRDDKAWRLTDALGLAGGHLEKRAGVNKVALVRTLDDGTETRDVIDVRQFYKTGEARYNPEVYAGDIVYVPETNAPDWTMIFQGLTSLSILGNALNN